MRTYARIQDGSVAELIKTHGDITRMFHPALVWVDVSTLAGVAESWLFDGTNFTPPPAAPARPPTPTIAELEAQLATISVQLAALSDKR